MKSLNNIRIGPKLFVALLTMLGFAGVIGFVAVTQLSRIAGDTDIIATESMASVHRVAEIRFDAAESRAAALEILTQLQLNYTSGADASAHALTDVEATWQANVAALQPLIKTAEQHALWDDANAKWQDYKREQDRAIAVAQDGLAGDAQKILVGLAKGKFETAVTAVSKLVDSANADAERVRLAADAAAASARRIVLVVLALDVAIGCAVAFLMTRAIARPLHASVALVRHIGAGRLDNQIETARTDEFGELLTGLATAQSQLLERATAEQRRAAEDRERAEADSRALEADRKRAESDRHALEEIQEMVAAVVDGQIDRRLATDGKSGFARQLAESLNTLIENVAGVVRGVTELVHSANEGDLTRRIPVEGRSGLDGQIGSGVNQLVAEMATMVANVKEAAESVSVGAAEISQGNASLSQRTEDQASSLQETAASMDEMMSTVRQTADNAHHANQLAIEARQRAEGGSEVVASAVQAMNGINAASRKIADIIGVIDEIAFQTNLLALNAAVEAARAGEQGRGFAVVASEVRSLASRSAEAAKEIKGLIHDSVTRVAEGTRVVSDSGETFIQVVDAVKKVGDIIAGIAAASAEQATGIEQVGSAVAKMDELTQQNAALVEQAAAASQALAEQSNSLSTMMSRYRVREDALRPDTARSDTVNTQPDTVEPTSASSAGRVERRRAIRPWSNRSAKSNQSSST
jgi:methyl-accepting chemotaxis protein